VIWRLENCGDLIPSRKRYLNSNNNNKKKTKMKTKPLLAMGKTKKSVASSGGSVNGSGNDFRMISWVSSSNIDIDDAESLRDSFRESYLSQSDCQSSNWRDRISEEDPESNEFQSSQGLLAESPRGGLMSEEMSERQVLEVLSSPPVSTRRASLLIDHLASLASNHLLSMTAFPPLSDLVVTEFKPHDSSKSSSRPSSRALKRADSSVTSPKRRTKPEGVEEESLRIRQTKNDSGRDNPPSHSSGRGTH
jgi:hypothetical protein